MKRKEKLQSLSNKIGVYLQRVFTSRKIGTILKPTEAKPKIINDHFAVFVSKCGLCEMDYIQYVGLTNRHLHQRNVEHGSLNEMHIKHMHRLGKPSLSKMFSVLRKCRSSLTVFRPVYKRTAPFTLLRAKRFSLREDFFFK